MSYVDNLKEIDISRVESSSSSLLPQLSDRLYKLILFTLAILLTTEAGSNMSEGKHLDYTQICIILPRVYFIAVTLSIINIVFENY